MLQRIFPMPVDNRFDGQRAALWLLGLYIALKLLMSVNSILNTASVAAGVDRIPLEAYGPAAAQTVLMLFALTSLGQLMLAIVSLTVLVRYRAMIPFVFVLLLVEHLARRMIIDSYAVERADGSPAGGYLNLGLAALLTAGLVLSLIRARRGQR